jgi:type IV secretory pathway TrbL component
MTLMNDPVKTVLDFTSIGVSIAAFMTQVLPLVTMVLACAWWCYRLYNEHQRGKLIRKELRNGDERLNRLDP